MYLWGVRETLGFNQKKMYRWKQKKGMGHNRK